MEDFNTDQTPEELSEDELLHWGIRGMKWGVRRYQNADGSLTAAGKKKRLAEQTEARVKNIEKKTEARLKQIKEESKVNRKVAKAEEKAKAKIAKAEKKYGLKKDDDSEKKQKPKTIDEMSNDELRDKIDRIRLENTLKSLTPQQESKGKAFLESAMKDVIAPAAKNIGRSYIEKTMKDKLGLGEKDDPIKQLRSEYDKLVLQKNIKDLKNQDDSIDKLSKKQRKLELERNIKNLEKGEDQELTEKETRNRKARLDKEYEDMVNPKKENPFDDMRNATRNYNTWKLFDKAREEFKDSKEAQERFYREMERRGYTNMGEEYVKSRVL